MLKAAIIAKRIALSWTHMSIRLEAEPFPLGKPWQQLEGGDSGETENKLIVMVSTVCYIATGAVTREVSSKVSPAWRVFQKSQKTRPTHAEIRTSWYPKNTNQMDWS